jgi:hypothetical protein
VSVDRPAEQVQIDAKHQMYHLPLAPLALLLFGGLYLFAQPYLGRAIREG